MRTTADPRELFRQIDATQIEENSYTFKVDKEPSPVADVEEGTEFEIDMDNVETIEIEFEELEGDEHDEALALEALRSASNAVVAGEEVGEEFDTIFIDRERGETYLVNSTQFGYHVVRERDDDGNVVRANYVGIFNDAAVRVR